MIAPKADQKHKKVTTQLISLEEAKKQYKDTDSFIVERAWQLFKKQSETDALKSWDKFSIDEFLTIIFFSLR